MTTARILVVDDEIDINTILSVTLRRAGVLVELLERDDTVAVVVRAALQAAHEIVGEDAVAELGQLDRQLGGLRGGDAVTPGRPQPKIR